jgi:hypothetical protein
LLLFCAALKHQPVKHLFAYAVFSAEINAREYEIPFRLPLSDGGKKLTQSWNQVIGAEDFIATAMK